MKRFIAIAIVLLPALFACNGNSEDSGDYASSVVLSKDKVDLVVGESVTITATVLPKSLGLKAVWSVLDEEYAEVSDGRITGKAEGVTYVIASSPDGNQKAACMVSVNPNTGYEVSVIDGEGKPVTAIYGYPGMVLPLDVIATDDKAHSFTWSVVDASVGSVTDKGVLTLAAKPATSPAYLYDAQSFLKVESEDGRGCKIPFRSSMLNGVQIDNDYTPAGTPAVVEKDGTHILAVLYEAVAGPAAIPADAVNLELSNTADFTLSKSDGAYTITTGPTDGPESSLSVSLPGSSVKSEIAQLRIDRLYGIKALFTDSSSSTLSFTWTEGVSADDDVSRPYTVYLYEDEACTDLEASFSIPAGDGCWNDSQPKFVFSGLAPATKYWFKVEETGATDKDSALIPATTDAFSIVMVSDSPAAVGDVILAEDFSQFCWGPDEISQSAGYWVTEDEPKWDTKVASSYSNHNAKSFAGTRGKYKGACWHAQKDANKADEFRLSNWAQGEYARVYLGPGYVFLSTEDYCAHIITSELNSIPEGQTAKLKVTLHAAGAVEGGEAVVAVQHGISYNAIIASPKLGLLPQRNMCLLKPQTCVRHLLSIFDSKETALLPLYVSSVRICPEVMKTGGIPKKSHWQTKNGKTFNSI